MRTKLSDFTVSEFVEILCGNVSILLEENEEVDSDTLLATVRNIIMEYRSISDHAGVQSFLHSGMVLTKSRGKVLFYEICLHLFYLKEFDKLKEILKNTDIRAAKMKDSMLEATLVSRLEKARYEYDRQNEDLKVAEKRDKESIIQSFDRQTSDMMAHFKFQIDPASMKVSLYAHLLSRYIREMRAKSNAFKRI